MRLTGDLVGLLETDQDASTTGELPPRFIARPFKTANGYILAPGFVPIQ
jgi:hypothetical protein